MGEAAQMRTIVSAKAITLPGGGDVHLIAPPPKPCVTILVHGVNDLAGCYARIESGLCQGLNERLDMPETLPGGMNNPGYMRSAGYSLPSDDSGKATNPDAMYYRRKFNAADDAKPTRSVVIRFTGVFAKKKPTSIKPPRTGSGWIATITAWTRPVPRKAGSLPMPLLTCRTCGARVSTANCLVSFLWIKLAAI